MATAIQVIQAAYNRSGVLATGVTVNSAQRDTGLERLGDFYRDMAEGLFGRQTDHYLTSATAYTAEEFQRVINSAGAVVTLPTTVTDQHSGETRPPRDGAIITVVVPGSDPTLNVYDASRAQWQDLGAITAAGYAPLTNRWGDAIKNLLAVLIADHIGIPVGPILAKRAASARLSIASRYGSEDRPSEGTFF